MAATGSALLGHAASDAVLSDQGEEASDLVDPGGRGRGDVHVELPMPLQPRLHLGMHVGCVVVSDQVHIEVFLTSQRRCGAGT
jgi:hypothetical protein